MDALAHAALVRRPDELLRLEPRKLASACPGDLTGRPLVAGLCGTDLQILRGLRSDPAEVLGHEGVIILDEPQAGLRGRFLLNPTQSNGNVMLGHTHDGLLQQRVRLPYALLGNLLPVPKALGDEAAVLAEPLGAVRLALRAINALTRPRRLLVVGRGTIGQLFALAAGHLGSSVETVQVVGSQQGQPLPRNFDAAVVCGTRDQTAPGISCALDALISGGVLHVFSGPPDGFGHPSLPAIDLAGLRKRNSADLAKSTPGDTAYLPDGRLLWVTGSRGASNADIMAAMTELGRSPTRYNHLLQVIADPHRFVSMVREAVTAPHRREWVKLALDMRNWDAQRSTALTQIAQRGVRDGSDR